MTAYSASDRDENDLNDPAIGEWEYIPGEVWRETEYLAAALIRGDYAALSAHGFPLSDDMVEVIVMRAEAQAAAEAAAAAPPPPARPAHPVGWLRCSKCDLWKPPDAFGVDTRKHSGRKSWCRACARQAERARWHRGRAAAGRASEPRRRRGEKRGEV